MELNDFVENFAAQFNETDISQFSLDTKFKDLEEWSSIIALMVMAMIDEEYDVQLKGDEMRSSSTIEDLFNIVKSKL